MNVQTCSTDWVEIETRHASVAYRPRPVTFVRGEGTRLWDDEGHEYLDFGTGIGVAALGHAHPALAQALAEQARTLMTCMPGYYHNDVRASFLDKLASIAPGNLKRVFLSNSGSEAVETALKLAKKHTGRGRIVAAMRAFHGRTLGSLSATWKAAYKKPFLPLVPGYAHVPFGDVEALGESVTDETAALLLEPIQGEGGIYPAPEGYLQAARDLCDAHGALLIFDEVQSGMGRTGTWFACEHDAVVPDVVCLAKALGGGVPLGATVFDTALGFEKGQHGSTFGGNPLACRAGLTVIETILSEGLLENAARVGAHFASGLQHLVETKPEQLREVRGRGVMLALQLRSKAGPVLSALQERGVLALSGGTTALRFLPPLNVTPAEVERVLEALEQAL